MALRRSYRLSSASARRLFSSGAAASHPPRLFAAGGASSRGVISTIDCHCGGLPARIAVDGLPDIPGGAHSHFRTTSSAGVLCILYGVFAANK